MLAKACESQSRGWIYVQRTRPLPYKPCGSRKKAGRKMPLPLFLLTLWSLKSLSLAESSQWPESKGSPVIKSGGQALGSGKSRVDRESSAAEKATEKCQHSAVQDLYHDGSLCFHWQKSSWNMFKYQVLHPRNPNMDQVQAPSLPPRVLSSPKLQLIFFHKVGEV